MSKTKNSIRSSKEHDNLSSCTSSSLSSDEEEIDARDLKPIKDYLSNRKELARQLFKSVKPEKIRMMLPQILKQMDLSELEEWCVSELNGMSKARITSILNGKPMLESSDTSESDDSGPSLEIISDTEEWTDDESIKKENGKGKVKRDKTRGKKKTQINKKNNLDKSNIKARCNINTEINDKNKDIKIKKEDDKDKGKEGDSLLDLLELEMRARAIRALIRKEEDIIPSSNPSQTSNGQPMEDNIETSQDDAKAKENCRKQLEKIISAQQSSKGEDEDVVLVVQPTPVVELLSSDSEKDDGTRVNKKLENVSAAEAGKTANNSDENARNSSKANSHDSKERKGTQEALGRRNDSNSLIKIGSNIRSEARTIMPERNVDIKNNTLSISISADNVAERRKRSKRRSQKQNAKMHITCSTTEDSAKLKQINVNENSEQSGDANKDIKEQSKSIPSDENRIIAKEESKSDEKAAKENKIEEDRLVDLDEIIDLDDYCDVMDIVSDDEKSEDNKVIVSPQKENKQSALQITIPKADSTETWASRYYQTDDVQNVIKESKMQSEIRKRLRERQRLSKLSKSPNLNLPSQSAAVNGSNTEKLPTGSVEEYLALKRAKVINVCTTNDNTSNNNTTQNNSDDTMQDKSSPITSSSDINTKESSVQNENISCAQESMDSTSNVQKTIVSETVVQLTEVTKAKNNS